MLQHLNKAYKSDKHIFVLAPMTSTVTTKINKIKAKGFQIGVKVHDSENWFFTEGNAESQTMMQELFPDFPKKNPVPRMISRPDIRNCQKLISCEL